MDQQKKSGHNRTFINMNFSTWTVIIIMLVMGSYTIEELQNSDPGTMVVYLVFLLALNFGIWRLMKLHLAYRRTKKVLFWTLGQKIKLIVYTFFTIMMFGRGVIGGLLFLSFFMILTFFLLRGILNTFRKFITPKTFFPSASFFQTQVDIVALEEIDKMDGTEFEVFIAKLYDALGYFSEVTPPSGDFGADVLTVTGKTKTAIQVKCYCNGRTVGVEAINEVLGGAGYWNAQRKMVITNRYYTKAAIQSAERNNVELINRDGLLALLKEYREVLEEKQRYRLFQIRKRSNK